MSRAASTITKCPQWLDVAGKERQLDKVISGYDNLASTYERVRMALAARDDVELWHGALLRLAESNLSSSAIAAFLRLSEHWPDTRPLALLALLGEAAARIGRHAGAVAAVAVLVRVPQVLGRLPDNAALLTVLRTLERLADVAPETLPLVTVRFGTLLASLDAAGFEAWAVSGLQTYGEDGGRRRAYFSLEDPLSQRLLGMSAESDLSRLERRLGAGLKGLWNVRAPLRSIKAVEGLPVALRASFAGGIPRLPNSFPGVPRAATAQLYRAAVAHIGAHLRHSTSRFPVGSLKPLQVALVSLIEDARIEALAMAEMPGLARLWAPFHDASTHDGATVPALLARLARTLFDNEHRDEHSWVVKGKELFAAARGQLHNPAISRQIGGLLGNELGQMRVQFNSRNHVVEPIYRDDNMGLWDFGDDADAVMDDVAIAVDAVRIERREAPEGGRREEEHHWSDAPRARASAHALDDGIPIATYPEWDYVLARARPEWTTILECEVAPVVVREPTGSAALNVDRRIVALARSAAIGRRIRERGLQDGDTLDLDACIAAEISRRGGLSLDPRVFVREVLGPRDLAALLLLDLSQSTADTDCEGRSVLATEREAATILAHAMDAAGDALAIHGFRSDGREKVRYYTLKNFDEAFDLLVHRRLAGLRSEQSTRLGAAMRHAGIGLAQQRAFRRVLLVLTDGEPSDVDTPDPRYLVEDARRAVQDLRRTGIEVFAFGIGNGHFKNLTRIVGTRRTLAVSRLAALPTRVMELYAELKK